MKKYILMAAATATMLAACSSDQELSNIDEATAAANEIVFNAVANGSNSKEQTRSTLITSSNFTTSQGSFDVWCYDGTNAYMTKTPITWQSARDNGNGQWYYQNEADKRYWTKTALNFYALSPSNIGTPTMSSTSQTFSYTLVDEYKSGTSATNTDVLYATAIGATKGDKDSQKGDNYVKLTFKHALAALVFKAKYDEKTITGKSTPASETQDHGVWLESIVIKGLKPTGTFNLPNTSTTGKDTKATVTPSGTDIDATLSFSTDALGTNAAGLNVNDNAGDDNPILVIPQTTTSQTDASGNVTGTYLEISCKIMTHGSYLKGSASTFETVKVPFAQTFEMGKKYIITLNFTAAAGNNELIMFDAEAAEWDETNTAINKDVQ